MGIVVVPPYRESGYENKAKNSYNVLSTRPRRSYANVMLLTAINRVSGPLT